jgi:hypothetical protein
MTKAVVSRGSQVHQVFQEALPHIDPVIKTKTENRTPTSADAAANLSKTHFLVTKKPILARKTRPKAMNAHQAKGRWR